MKRQYIGSTHCPRFGRGFMPGVFAVVTVLLTSAPALCWEDIMTPNLAEGNWWRYRISAGNSVHSYKLTEKVVVDSASFGFIESTVRPTVWASGQRFPLSAVKQATVKFKFTFLLTQNEDVEVYFITDSLIPQSISATGSCGPVDQPSLPTPQVIKGVYFVTQSYVIQYSDTIPVMVLPRRGDSTVQALMSERDYFGSVNGGYKELALFDLTWQIRPADLRSDSVSLWAHYSSTCGCYSDEAKFKRGYGLVGLRWCRCMDVYRCDYEGVSLILEAFGTPHSIHTRPSGRRGIHLAPSPSSASTSPLFSINGRSAGTGSGGVHERGTSQMLLRHEASEWRRFIPWMRAENATRP